MAERTREEVGELVKDRMRDQGLTDQRLRQQTGIDRKTLAGLLDGSRWPQAETRLKVETELGWRAGSIEDLRDGEDATELPVDDGSSRASPLAEASFDDLLEEIRRRALIADQAKQGPRRPLMYRRAPGKNPGVGGDEYGDERDQLRGG